MRFPENALSALTFGEDFLFFLPTVEAQTKRLKRPGSRTSIFYEDQLIRKPFSIYDRLLEFDSCEEALTLSNDSNIELPEDTFVKLFGISEESCLMNIMGESTLVTNDNYSKKKYRIDVQNL